MSFYGGRPWFVYERERSLDLFHIATASKAANSLERRPVFIVRERCRAAGYTIVSGGPARSATTCRPLHDVLATQQLNRNTLSKIKAALQTLLVGGLAAGAAYWLAHLFG
jgi:hypothetical protein